MLQKVLIVEDFDDSRSFMKIVIERCGYLALEASDGIEALEIFKLQRPDIILMDISLPMVDGITLTKAIREIDDSDIPIIAVTAFGSLYRDEVIAAGCNGYLAKPVDPGDLKMLLNEFLNSDFGSEIHSSFPLSKI